MNAKDRRELIRSKLSNLYIPYYDKLCERLPLKWAPYSGLRNFTDQDILYKKGRISSGPVITNARGGESPHNYGCASDWVIFTEQGYPYWIQISDPQWKEYTDAVVDSGLRPGVNFGDVDHNELKISIPWPKIYLSFHSGGMNNAMARISEVLVQTNRGE